IHTCMGASGRNGQRDRSCESPPPATLATAWTGRVVRQRGDRPLAVTMGAPPDVLAGDLGNASLHDCDGGFGRRRLQGFMNECRKGQLSHGVSFVPVTFTDAEMPIRILAAAANFANLGGAHGRNDTRRDV